MGRFHVRGVTIECQGEDFNEAALRGGRKCNELFAKLRCVEEYLETSMRPPFAEGGNSVVAEP